MLSHLPKHHTASNNKGSDVGRSTQPDQPPRDWAAILSRIYRGESAACCELYQSLERGVRFVLMKRLGVNNLDDAIQDVFSSLFDAVRTGRIQNGSALPAYTHGIVKHVVAKYVRLAIAARDQSDIEALDLHNDSHIACERKLLEEQHAGLMVESLRSMEYVDREILRRFYLDAQPQDRICNELNLTDTQFRLRKSRAKARLVEAVRKKLSRPPGHSVREQSLLKGPPSH